ncbi:hypothetical protein [Curtobacterium aetherium]|uniref:Uncharacterized protein n=1 Tax=Curtobacterium aetherium TaxID=2841594 RepID=A0ACD1E048_9MICO|nr:hypothetical protein [Curtobacterium sp. L6-1]QWS32277.1 hypothetical protein KM842_08045 [Curtobacterium sp. L6-1]
MTADHPTDGPGPGHHVPGPGPSGWAAVPPPGPRSAPPAPRPAERTGTIAPGASRIATTGAALTVVSVVVVEFLAGVVGLLGSSTLVGPFLSHGGTSLVEAFVQGVFVARTPFYVGAFLALAFLVPVVPRAPLPVVLVRALLAGAAGALALALVGVATGAYAAVRQGSVGRGLGRVFVDVVTTPLQIGLPLTLMLLGTATVAWLLLGRPRTGPSTPPRR